MLHNIHFSLEEANRLLESIKDSVKELVELKRELDRKRYNILKHQFFGGIGPNGTGEFPPELEHLVEIMKHISSMGILIKGIENGLLDFPHLRANGEEVYLCWKLGEDQINYWHTIPEGFAGRKSIDEL